MKKLVFTFGRMNPVTSNHETVVNRVISLSRTLGADPRVYVAHTQNEETDFLSYVEKLPFIKESFGKIVYPSETATILELVRQFKDEGYDDITFVSPEDKIEAMTKLLQTENVSVVGAGINDPDTNDMLQYVAENNIHKFMENAPSRLENTKINEMFQMLRDRIPSKIPLEDEYNNRFEFFLNEKDAINDIIESENEEPEEIEESEPETFLPEEQGSGDILMAGFVSVLLHSRTVTHIMHLRTRKFSVHKSLQKYYENIPDIVDSLVESYQGKYGILSSFPDQYEVRWEDPIEYLEQMNQFVYSYRSKLPQDTELQNIIDEIASLINTTLYRLKYLG